MSLSSIHCNHLLPDLCFYYIYFRLVKLNIMSFFTKLLFILTIFLFGGFIPHGQPTDTAINSALVVEEDPDDGDCPKYRPIKALCGYISSLDPDEDYGFLYRRKVLEAACADPATDTDEEIFAKIRIMWDKYEDRLVCANTSFDTVHGNIIKYAIASHANDFFNDVLIWGVNLNRVDPVDDMTVLDYVNDQMRIYHSEPGIVRKLKYYHSELRKCGAKYKSEL